MFMRVVPIHHCMPTSMPARALYVLAVLTVVLYLSAQDLQAQISSGDVTAEFESGFISDLQIVGSDSIAFESRRDIPGIDEFGWFYFAVANSNGRTATFFLINRCPSWQDSLHNPVYSNDNLHWQPINEVWHQGGPNSDTLGFRLQLQSDTVWIAQNFPFTMTRMYTFLDTLESSPMVTRQTIGTSVHGRPIDMLTLTDNSYPEENKRTVWLISRQHPTETPSSYLLQGLLRRVLDSSIFSEAFLRDIVLMIVPIINVDGVVEGFARRNANGVDLNRNWHSTPGEIDDEEPEIRGVHLAIDDYLSSGGTIDFFMDLHSSRRSEDHGYRVSEADSDPTYFSNQENFLKTLEILDHWMTVEAWSYLGDGSPQSRVSAMCMFRMYGLNALLSENPLCRRADSSFVTIPDLYLQGADWAKAIYSAISDCCSGDRGNVDGDANDVLNISDLVVLVAYLFSGGAPPICLDEANINGDPSGSINVTDLTYIVAYLFLGGSAPAECP